MYAELDVDLTQRVGRLKIRGYGYAELECDGTTRPWSVDITGDNGLFKGGKTASVTMGYACGDYDCNVSFLESTVQLKGSKREQDHGWPVRRRPQGPPRRAAQPDRPGHRGLLPGRPIDAEDVARAPPL